MLIMKLCLIFQYATRQRKNYVVYNLNIDQPKAIASICIWRKCKVVIKWLSVFGNGNTMHKSIILEETEEKF